MCVLFFSGISPYLAIIAVSHSSLCAILLAKFNNLLWNIIMHDTKIKKFKGNVAN